MICYRNVIFVRRTGLMKINVKPKTILNVSPDLRGDESSCLFAAYVERPVCRQSTRG